MNDTSYEDARNSIVERLKEITALKRTLEKKHALVKDSKRRGKIYKKMSDIADEERELLDEYKQLQMNRCMPDDKSFVGYDMKAEQDDSTVCPYAECVCICYNRAIYRTDDGTLCVDKLAGEQVRVGDVYSGNVLALPTLDLLPVGEQRMIMRCLERMKNDVS